MISTGTQLLSFINSLNADAEVDATLADVLVDNARAIIEAERPWMVLRKTARNLSASTSDTWETEKSLAGITDFGRFHGDFPVRLNDGGNRTEFYRQVPFEDRLEWKDVSNTFVFDANSNTIYLNGLIAFAGTIWLNYIADSGAIDLTADTPAWSPFKPRFLPILGFYAIGIHKGAVDYDSINRQMLPANQAALDALKNALVTWDNDLQLSALEGNDPSEAAGGYPRSGAIQRE
jgi:hypothetical protein